MTRRYDFDEVPSLLLERRPGLVFFLGGPDTGKTTLFTRTAALALADGLRVGMIDADVGQTTIGPPATIGMLVAEGDLPDLSRAAALYFVGSTSPVGHLLETTVGSRVMVDRATRSGADMLLFDSSGLVQPPYGQVLKYHKLEALRPDCVVAIERGDELAALTAWLTRCRSFEVLRVRSSIQARTLSATERAYNRKASYRRYFAGATVRTFAPDALASFPPGFLAEGARLDALLVGLVDSSWQTVAVGIIVGSEGAAVRIVAPYPAAVPICGVVAGYLRVSPAGVELGRVPRRSVA